MRRLLLLFGFCAVVMQSPLPRQHTPWVPSCPKPHAYGALLPPFAGSSPRLPGRRPGGSQGLLSPRRLCTPAVLLLHPQALLFMKQFGTKMRDVAFAEVHTSRDPGSCEALLLQTLLLA